MKLDPIVFSLLDTDLYKFNMDQVIFHKHTDLCGEYFFKCRNRDVKFTEEMREMWQEILARNAVEYEKWDDRHADAIEIEKQAKEAYEKMIENL